MRLSVGTIALALAATIAVAEPVGVGGSLPTLRLVDQHDASWEPGPDLRVLVVTHDMDGGAMVRDVLGDTPQATLDARGIAYVADISRMPGLVSRLIAVPRMRKRPYRVLLDRDGSATRDLPAAPGKATLIRLDRLRILSIEQLGDRQTLGAALLPPP